MNKKAQESICLVVIHSNNKELKKISSSLLDKGFYLVSSMNKELYACTYDNIEISFGQNYKYETLRFKKGGHHDSTISKINKNRRTIGLTDI